MPTGVYQHKPFSRETRLKMSVIPELNLIIECDGDYWHSLGRVANKDKAENAYLIKCGYNLLRLSEEDIMNNKFIQIFEERLVF